MAYDLTKLVPQNPSAGPGTVTLYTYITEDTVTAGSYFDEAFLTLSVGDLIKVVLTSSSVPVSVTEYVVVSITAGVVVVTSLTVSSTASAMTFLALTDTPGAFSASDTLKVNAGADAVEFVTV